MKKKIKILDCTLRDGGYYNNWEFSEELINSYLNAMSKSNIDIVEIGFRFLTAKSYRGPCAFSRDEFLDTLKIPKNINLAVMINASELINNKYKDIKKNLNYLFNKKKKSKVKMVRIACHYDEISKILPYLDILKKKKFKIAINIMQISLRTDQEILQLSKAISIANVDILYFADSTGSLENDKVKKITNNLKKYWKGEIGIHAHNNLDMAMVNVQKAIDNGVTWVDGTVLGMGRGPGNAKTEYLIAKYKKNINLLPITILVNNEFTKLQKQYNWGTNLFYFISGIHQIHPTFIQEMLSDKRYSDADILVALNYLKKNSAHKFDKELFNLEQKFYKYKINGTWKPRKIFQNKKLLIIGSGDTVKKNLSQIEKFIKKQKPIVIAINTSKILDENLINFRAICNSVRLITDIEKFKNIKQAVITPFKNLPKKTTSILNKKKILNFGLQVIKDKFEVFDNYAILPNSHVISYVLAISISGAAEKVFLAGFDGYSSEDPRRLKTDELINMYNKYEHDKPDVISITPTKYELKTTSIYTTIF